MLDLDDNGLLKRYAEQNSEEAFAAIVSRHINKVYSVALRQTRNPLHAEEITQAVFVILAKKAETLGRRVILSGWLYQTARLASLTFLKSEIRRARREQEAQMQSVLNEPADETWGQIAPLLDSAMASLNEIDRHAVVLRFFDGKSMREVGDALGATEDTAKKRVARALEKLKGFFAKRGVHSTTAIIAGAISSNSVQTAPPTLAQTVTAAAIAKGATAGSSTLTLVKGALKVMAWTKAKIVATVVCMGIVVATGATTVAVKEYQDRRTESWEIPTVYDTVNHDFEFDLSKPQVRIKRSIYPGFKVGSTDTGFGWIPRGDGTFVQTNYNNFTSIGLGVTLKDIVKTAYDAQDWQIAARTALPQKPLYDFVSDLPQGTARPLQQLIEKKFGLDCKWETIETNVLVLNFADTEVKFKSAKSLMNIMNITNLTAYDLFQGTSREFGGTNFYINQTMGSLVGQMWLQSVFGTPIVDETGFTNRFDCVFKSPAWWPAYPEQQAYKDALRKQLGLELIPAQRPVKMLVVEKTE